MQFLGYGKVNVFIFGTQFLNNARAQRAQVIYDAPHKLLGRRCAGSKAKHLAIAEFTPVYFRRALHQPGFIAA